MRSTFLRFGVSMVILGLVLSACGTQTGQTDEPDSSEPAASGEPQTGEPVEIRWFCCLGAGDNAETQVPTEQRIVEEFNASHDDIELVLEIVDYDSAFDAMSVEVAGGNAPDIVGPVGVSGAEAFHGQWLDLTPLIESTGYDLSQYPDAAVDFYNVGGEGQVGIPFASYPSIMYYQRDMFDEAGLEYPPASYDEPYILDGEEVEWNFDTVREIAKRLTVDVNNNDATSPDFDPEQIEQYGYDPTFQDLRAIGSYFGAGSLVADDNATAQIPDPWREAWTWHYENVFTEHVTMTAALRDAPEFGNENPFRSRRTAMALSHLWFTCCATPVDAEGNEVPDPQWDIAAVPSNDGTVTSNFNADTFRIWGDTEHPEEAFEVLTYLLDEVSVELLDIYGAFPARTSDEETFIANLNERFPQGVNWQVALDGVPFADKPSFEAWTPAYQETFAAIVSFGDTLRTDDGLDIDAAIDDFQAELQAIYDASDDAGG